MCWLGDFFASVRTFINKTHDFFVCYSFHYEDQKLSSFYCFLSFLMPRALFLYPPLSLAPSLVRSLCERRNHTLSDAERKTKLSFYSVGKIQMSPGAIDNASSFIFNFFCLLFLRFDFPFFFRFSFSYFANLLY